MPQAYFSTVFEYRAQQIWSQIRNFGRYSWAGPMYDARMEDGRAGDAVGGVRVVGEDGLRQRLVAHSDLDRTYTYTILKPLPWPIEDYVSTIRVTPVTDGDRSFVEWIASFSCAPDESDRWEDRFGRSFAGWLASLRGHLAA